MNTSHGYKRGFERGFYVGCVFAIGILMVLSLMLRVGAGHLG